MYKQEKRYYKRSFLYALIMACVLFLPFVIMGNGVMVYYGDFDAQQMPFYELCVRAVQSGETGWNWQTDLGVNFVGSYSSCTLGSPFFWFAALFPAAVAKYLMAPLLAVKIALSSLFSYMYIRRFTRTPDSALIGGLLYAFSGFSINSLVFNHFHEAICFFPLLLIGLEEAVVNKRRGVFALAVALNALVNYFFFIGECVFLVLYFIMRMAMSSDFRIKAKDFFCLAFESIVGVMIACILFIPSVLQMLSSARATSLLSGYDFLAYEEPFYYINILKSFFFVSDVGGSNPMLPMIDNTWTSTAFYLPLVSTVGVIAFMKSAKKHWAKGIILVCLIMAFIPGLNSLFVLFNSNYYTRWFYMPVLICCIATAIAIDDDRTKQWNAGFAITGTIVALLSLLLLFFPVECTYPIYDKDGNVIDNVYEVYPHFMANDLTVSYVYIGATVAALALFYLLFKHRGAFTEKGYLKRLTAAVVACSMLVSMGMMLYAKFGQGVSSQNYIDVIDDNIEINDDEYYRVEINLQDGTYVNLNMIWGMDTFQSFQSVVPYGTEAFHDYIRVGSEQRGSLSVADMMYYPFRSLIGVKYYIRSGSDGYTNEDYFDILPNFSYHDTQGDYIIYKNDYCLPMGFAYDSYVLYKDADECREVHGKICIWKTDRLALNSVALTPAQAEKFSDILTEIPEEYCNGDYWTDEQFVIDASARIADGVKSFQKGKNSFTAQTDYTADKLVVFSVPYDNGWSASIDGEIAEIECVNGGMMAIRVPAGEHEILFEYTTPGLMLGIICTIIGAVLLAGWFVLWYAVLHKGVRKHACEGVSAHQKYIDMLTGNNDSWSE